MPDHSFMGMYFFYNHDIGYLDAVILPDRVIIGNDWFVFVFYDGYRVMVAPFNDQPVHMPCVAI